MYVLPEELREKLKEPLGLLLKEDEFIDLAQKKKCVVAVGDMVTFTLLKHGITPCIAVFDFKCKREFCDKAMMKLLKKYGDIKIKVKNQPATISEELWEAVKKGYRLCKNKTVAIVVDGEEDLASLAAIALAPSDVTVIYGLPNKGVDLIEVTQREKDIVKDVLKQM
ncbi:MAG TPA: DUF359 domain-containing protein [Thermoplasmata archaeon]|nr:DUF359 domain-containing protein [Thermoplasmata archaeon]